MKSPEQEAREMLARMEVPGALKLSDGSVAELATVIAEMRSLRSAVMDPGPVVGYHMAVETQSRKDWPYLWAAIDRLVARVEGWEK